MLQLTNFSSGYGPIRVLQDVSMRVGMGELVALLGQNGAGKSTLLKAIVGAAGWTRGSVKFDGEELVGKRPSEIAAAGIALVPEGRRIFGELTTKENLVVAEYAAPNPRSRVNVLDYFPELGHVTNSRAAMLSGGEQQMLAIARALITRPRILLIDELSLGLAPLVTKRIYRTLQGLSKEGLTIVFVEQGPETAIAVADSAFVLSNGQMVAAGGASDLAERRNFLDLYFGIGTGTAATD